MSSLSDILVPNLRLNGPWQHDVDLLRPLLIEGLPVEGSHHQLGHVAGQAGHCSQGCLQQGIHWEVAESVKDFEIANCLLDLF